MIALHYGNWNAYFVNDFYHMTIGNRQKALIRIPFPVKHITKCEMIYEMFHILNCGFEIKQDA